MAIKLKDSVELIEGVVDDRLTFEKHKKILEIG